MFNRFKKRLIHYTVCKEDRLKLKGLTAFPVNLGTFYSKSHNKTKILIIVKSMLTVSLFLTTKTCKLMKPIL